MKQKPHFKINPDSGRLVLVGHDYIAGLGYRPLKFFWCFQPLYDCGPFLDSIH